MVSQRLARKEGHRRKFLCVVDDTPECDRAVAYAAIRAARSGGGLVMLYAIPPGDFQHWRGVEEMMRVDAHVEAETRLGDMAARAHEFAGVTAERIVKEGKPSEAINAMIEEDRDISILVLAAATGNDGPGPLVSSIAAKSNGGFSIPVTIVPGDMSDEDITAVT